MQLPRIKPKYVLKLCFEAIIIFLVFFFEGHSHSHLFFVFFILSVSSKHLESFSPFTNTGIIFISIQLREDCDCKNLVWSIKKLYQDTLKFSYSKRANSFDYGLTARTLNFLRIKIRCSFMGTYSCAVILCTDCLELV